MTLDLSDSTVYVTGAAGRLGGALAQTLKRAGATVAGLDAAESEDLDLDAFAAADLTDETAVADAFAALKAASGPADAVVHTVGMWDGKPFAQTGLEDWRRVLDVNLTSAFLVFRAAVRQMQSAGQGGRLVGIASGQGLVRGVGQQAAYSASKAGVVRLVEALADELADDGITASAVAPSMILFGGEEPGTAGVPVARIADLCGYLCTPEGGAAHTGATLQAFGSLR